MRKSFLVLSIAFGLILFSLNHPKITHAATLFQDDFTDVDNTELSQHNATWTNVLGRAYILNNQLTFDSSGVAEYYLNPFTSQTNQCASTDYSVNGLTQPPAFSIFTRFNPTTNNSYVFQYTGIGDNWSVGKSYDYNVTPLVSGSFDRYAVTSLKLCTIGTVTTAYINTAC